MRRAVLWALLLMMLLGLSGCAAIDGVTRPEAAPDLRLLEPPAYQEVPPDEEATSDSQSAVRVDLWLDASQVMGGINPSEESMYPHSSRKYREGGFHYRYENTVGMYETVLRCMLSSVEGSRVRLLRCGSERLPDEYLMAQGVADAQATQEQLRSIRRDMLTYAIDPMPGIFGEFSGDKMTDSFYSPGTPKLNRMDALNASLLENPALKDQMSAALDRQIQTIQKNSATSLLAMADDTDYPLLYALDNLDLSRLSIITCDPAAIRRLTSVDADGAAHAMIQELLSERGVFDAGLSAGLYAFTLDYMGQLASFGAADFSEPLLWGRLDYDNSTGKTNGTLVMPRTLLTLVIGHPDQVDAFAAALENQLNASDTLNVPRGPQNSQLAYTHQGQTVVQEPFGFAFEYTEISRAQISQISQYTDGVQLTADAANVSKSGSLTTVTLAPVDGAQPDRTLTLQLPLAQLDEGMTLNAADLENVGLSVQNTLLLSDVLPNSPDTILPAGAQSIALRDKVYVFAPQEVESPVHCTGIVSDGQSLTVTLNVDGSALVPGFYRLQFSADLPGDSMQWQTPEWIRALNTNITNEQIATWEDFSAVLTKYERKREYITRAFHHAWGDASNTSYRDHTVPDFPPVMLAPGLSELVSQLQDAAHPGTTPYIRYVFDLFVDNK